MATLDYKLIMDNVNNNPVMTATTTISFGHRLTWRLTKRGKGEERGKNIMHGDTNKGERRLRKTSKHTTQHDAKKFTSANKLNCNKSFAI